jgi:hypothetical protein
MTLGRKNGLGTQGQLFENAMKSTLEVDPYTIKAQMSNMNSI